MPFQDQSTPGLVYGQVPTADEWNSYFAGKQDSIGSTPLSLNGGTMQGLLITATPTTSSAGLVLPPGAAPAQPIDGALWTTTAGLYAQINGATVGPYVSTAAGGVGLANNNVFTGNNTFSGGNTTFTVGTTNVIGPFQLNGVNVALGTSGGTVPLLSGNNTWSGTNSYSNIIFLLGSSSGTITQQTQANAGTYNWNWPITAGSSGQVLTSQGGGSNVMIWTTPPGSAVPFPQGRLTLSSGTPVMTSSVTGGQTLYYAPYVGNIISVFDGTSIGAIQFTSSPTDTVGLSLSLGGSGSWVANTLYDVFVAYNGGNPTLCTGPAWSSSTARSAAGAIGRYSGFLVNSNASAMTGQTGPASTVSIPQYQGMYVGTIAIDAAVAGQVSFTLGTSASGGGASFINIWNYYNRVPVTTTIVDNSASYSYASATIRSANNSTSNRITFVSGVSEDGVSAFYTATNNTASGGYKIGIGVDSTTAFYGAPNQNSTNQTNVNTSVISPNIGLHYLQALEAGSASPATFNIASNNSLMAMLKM